MPKLKLNPDRIYVFVCLWLRSTRRVQQLTMRQQQCGKSRTRVSQYLMDAKHTHTHHKLHRKSTRENTAKSSRVDKVRTSTKLQLISDALRRRTQGEHTIEQVHTRIHTHTHTLKCVHYTGIGVAYGKLQIERSTDAESERERERESDLRSASQVSLYLYLYLCICICLCLQSALRQVDPSMPCMSLHASSR